MTTAAPAFAGNGRSPVRSLLLVLFTIAGIGGASAQSAAPAPPAATERPPVAVKGWTYTHTANDVHMFRCGQPSCGAGSKVSYRFYPAGTSMNLAQFRDGQEQIIKALDQRTPGQRTTILAVDGDKGTTTPRTYKARRLMVAPNGTNEYQVSGMLFGSRAAASVISSASDEKASNDNYAVFATAVMLVVAPKPR